MFSTTSSSLAPRRAAVRSNGYRFTHTIDELDVMLIGRPNVIGLSRTATAGVQLGCSVLTRPSMIFREAGEIRDRAGPGSRRPGAAGGSAGGDDLDAQIGPVPRANSTIPVFPRPTAGPAHRWTPDDADARSSAVQLASIGPDSIGEMTKPPGMSGVKAHRPPGRSVIQPPPVDRARSGAARPARGPQSIASGSSNRARAGMTGPVSTPWSTKWTVTPNTLTP